MPGQNAVVISNIYVEYSNIGDTYYKLEDFTNAAKYYEMSMQNRKLYWSSYYKLAKCYALTSEWSKALPMYKKILKRDPENTSIKASLAYIYLMQGELKEAETLLQELLETDPNNEKYIENYLALLTADEEYYKNKKDDVSKYLVLLKENYSENKNIEIFENSIKKLEPEEKKEENTQETSDSNALENQTEYTESNIADSELKTE
ncbi:MAG: tetratricopeptide repeat protein [Clostridia bacterium]|nr:tetratricopeptide repeat protein [Clostridia bacterium]